MSSTNTADESFKPPNLAYHTYCLMQILLFLVGTKYIYPKKAKGDNLTSPPCGFSKTAFFREMVKPWLFLAFNIII